MGHEGGDPTGMGHKDMQHGGMGHGSGGHVDHRGHEQMFRRRFWISLILSLPVLAFSPAVQGWLGYSLPTFFLSNWITPAFATIVFLYGGLPFLRMAAPEVRSRRPA
jgi:Cu2+-exporting ATPase